MYVFLLYICKFRCFLPFPPQYYVLKFCLSWCMNVCNGSRLLGSASIFHSLLSIFLGMDTPAAFSCPPAPTVPQWAPSCMSRCGPVWEIPWGSVLASLADSDAEPRLRTTAVPQQVLWSFKVFFTPLSQGPDFSLAELWDIQATSFTPEKFPFRNSEILKKWWITS